MMRAQEAGRRTARREAPEIREPKAEDRNLVLLQRLRRQRVERYEQERMRAKAEWRRQRMALRDLKQRRREAQREAKEYWQRAREEFIGMTITSGQYRRAKTIYERMKEIAAQRYLDCQEAVAHCRLRRSGYFAACLQLQQAQRQHEKLEMFRQELRQRQQKGDD
ncbi:MAG TPA: hypothetical protein VIM12_13605 [Noviherbaspirillum sp.]|jgi:hypothetical protein|uniref:hypothetical protein n=1 Tax=Noviherbaspirillum sp. TaxID=1926288 RepID=UPI002F93BED0